LILLRYRLIFFPSFENSKSSIDTSVNFSRFASFFVGFDQGHFFSIVQGEDAFIEQFLHEFTHDMRHAAGFPCH